MCKCKDENKLMTDEEAKWNIRRLLEQLAGLYAGFINPAAINFEKQGRDIFYEFYRHGNVTFCLLQAPIVGAARGMALCGEKNYSKHVGRWYALLRAYKALKGNANREPILRSEGIKVFINAGLAESPQFGAGFKSFDGDYETLRDEIWGPRKEGVQV